jgi:hypothetical protein
LGDADGAGGAAAGGRAGEEPNQAEDDGLAATFTMRDSPRESAAGARARFPHEDAQPQPE